MRKYNRFRKRRTYQQQMPTHDHGHSCVCNTVRKIVKAQDEVADDGCSTSCDSAIRQLHNQGSKYSHRHTTVPFMLYCKKTCKPFVGNGIFNNLDESSFFGCAETPVFRAIHFVNNHDCCVKLELLVPASDGCEINGPRPGEAQNACSFFTEENSVTGFFATGICLTVDLEQFMGITCLDPITPL